MEDLTKKTEELEKALEVGNETEESEHYLQSPALKVEDITDKIQDVLSDKAKEVLNTAQMAKHTIVEKDNRFYEYRVMAVNTSDPKVGAMLLARMFNDLVEQFDISLLLSKPCQIDLVEPLTLEMAKECIKPKTLSTATFVIPMLPIGSNVGTYPSEMPELYKPTQEEIKEAHRLIKD